MLKDENGAGAPPTENQDAGAPDYSNIPEDVIKSHPLYKQVLTESIERRKEIAELKKGATPPEPPPSPATDPMQAALDRIAKLENQLAESATNTLRLQAAKQAGLPEKFANRIVGKTFEEMLADAQEIASAMPKVNEPPPTSPPNVPSGTPGNAAGAQRDLTMLNKITQRMGSNFGVSSPFDPGVQRQAGGGAFNKE